MLKSYFMHVPLWSDVVTPSSSSSPSHIFCILQLLTLIQYYDLGVCVSYASRFLSRIHIHITSIHMYKSKLNSTYSARRHGISTVLNVQSTHY